MPNYFRNKAEGDTGQIYYTQDGKIYKTNITQLAGNEDQHLSQGDALSAGKKILQEQYGINYDTLGQEQLGDIGLSLAAGNANPNPNDAVMTSRASDIVRNAQDVDIKNAFGGSPYTIAMSSPSGQSSQSSSGEIVQQSNTPLGYGIDPKTGKLAPVTTKPAQQWSDPATGQPTPVGVGMPNSEVQAGSRILNEQDLQAKRNELSKAGVPQSEWSKYISSPDAKGNIYYNRPATLIGPNGQKKVVASGSGEANQLLASGWSLGGQINDTTINSSLLTKETDIKIGSPLTNDTYIADTARASATEDSKAVDELIKYYEKILTPQESDLSKQVKTLLGEVGTAAGELTGRGEMQATEEEKRGVNTIIQSIASKNTLLKKKLAEIDALTKSYDLANVQEEGRPQTLSRLQGAQARNYRMYIAQKNMLTSEAGYLQAEILGLQGEREAAQNAADKAVELEYADRQSAYSSKLAQLNILQPQLEKEEARYGQAVQMVLQQQAQALAEAKQNKKDIMSVKLSAIDAGISDSKVLTSIGNAKSYDEALQILGENMPKATGNNTGFTQIGTDVWGNPTYGFVNKDTGVVTPYNQPSNNQPGSGVVTDASGNSYDITSYATDPNHEASVQRILQNMGQMQSVGQMDSYIKSVAPNSPVTGQMVANASQKYGVSWESIMAIMQQDSNFGTLGAGARSYNPGNVGNTDTATSTGNLVNMGNWQAGVDAVGNWLAKHKSFGVTSDPMVQNPTVVSWAKEYISSGKMPTGVKPALQASVVEAAKTLSRPSGMLIDKTTLTSPDTNTISGEKKDALLALYDVQKKIEQAKVLFNNIAWTGVTAGIFSKIKPTKDQQQYMDLRAEIVDLLARARTGAVINAEEQRNYEKKLPSTFSQPLGLGRNGETSINDLRNSIAGILESKLGGYGLDIIGREIIVDGKTLIRAYENGVLGWKDK